MVLTVAVDRSAEAARPWIEAARPTHPALIDRRHLVADLYNMVNVPTVVWVDEVGRIVRPNDVAFGTDTFRHITGIQAARHLGASARLGARRAACRLAICRRARGWCCPRPAISEPEPSSGLASGFTNGDAMRQPVAISSRRASSRPTTS